MVGPGRPPKRPRQEEEYEPEKIIKHRLNASCEAAFLVQWKGYPGEDTWEPPDSLDHLNVMKRYIKRMQDRGQTLEDQKIFVKLVLTKLPDKAWLEAIVFDSSEDVKIQVSMNKKDHAVFIKEQIKKWQTEVIAKCRHAGLPEVTITILDSERVGPPPQFEYITSCMHGKSVTPKGSHEFVVGCQCDNNCQNSDKCCPQIVDVSKGIDYNYEKNGLLRLTEGQPIYECNLKCKCGQECANRVVQKGAKVELDIFRTKDRGWGVRTNRRIEEGTFIAEYVGEIIKSDEAEERGSVYLFDLDFEGESVYTIDATHFGNVSRFFNHSCEPNLVSHSVWIDNPDPQMPHIAFFALKDIDKGQELTFDYKTAFEATGKSGGVEKRKQKLIPCKCGAKTCRKYLKA